MTISMNDSKSSVVELAQGKLQSRTSAWMIRSLLTFTALSCFRWDIVSLSLSLADFLELSKCNGSQDESVLWGGGGVSSSSNHLVPSANCPLHLASISNWLLDWNSLLVWALLDVTLDVTLELASLIFSAELRLN